MGLLDRDYSEKRDYIRMTINTPINIRFLNSDVSLEGYCHDLSGSGMLISANQEIASGTELMVTLMSDHGHSPILQAHCSVTRAEKGPQSTTLCGLEIVDIINKPELEVDSEEA